VSQLVESIHTNQERRKGEQIPLLHVNSEHLLYLVKRVRLEERIVVIKCEFTTRELDSITWR
jgi:hypothetical protein